MHIQKHFFKLNALACAFFLTACGAGGGISGGSIKLSDSPSISSTSNGSVNTSNSNNSSTSGSTPSSNNNTNTNNNNTNQTNPNNGKSIGQTSVLFENQPQFSSYASMTDNDISNIDVFNRNALGSVTLVQDPSSTEQWRIINHENQDVGLVNSGYSYTRFGVINSSVQANTGENGVRTELFMQGQRTTSTNMPTTGTAQYVGHALHLDQSKLQTHYSEAMRGVSRFNVDYGERTMEGTISSESNQFNPVNIQGVISGNRFSTASGSEARVYGYFNGPNAEELGGVYSRGTKENPEFMGSFGAKKQ